MQKLASQAHGKTVSASLIRNHAGAKFIGMMAIALAMLASGSMPPNIKVLPAYAVLEAPTLLSDINSIKGALECLEKSPLGASEYNTALTVSEDVVRELITRETIAFVGERIFKSQKTKLSWQFPMGVQIRRPHD